MLWKSPGIPLAPCKQIGIFIPKQSGIRLGHSCKNLVIRWLILVLIFQYLLWWFIFLNLVAKHAKSLVAQLAFLGILIKMSRVQITPSSTIEL